MARDRLTLKQQMFIEHYLANGGNATDAARQAGYAGSEDTLRNTGAKLVANGYIAAEIEKRVKAVKGIIGADEVLTVISAHARGDFADFVCDDGGPIPMSEAKRKGVSRIVKKLTFDTENRIRQVELYDAQTAAVTMGKYYGLWKEDAPPNDQVQALVSGIVRAVTETLNEYIDDIELRDRIRTRIAERVG